MLRKNLCPLIYYLQFFTCFLNVLDRKKMFISFPFVWSFLKTDLLTVPKLKKKKKSRIQLVSVNDLQEIQPTARNVMGNSQKAYFHRVSYCLRQKWAFLEATLCL